MNKVTEHVICALLATHRRVALVCSTPDQGRLFKRAIMARLEGCKPAELKQDTAYSAEWDDGAALVVLSLSGAMEGWVFDAVFSWAVLDDAGRAMLLPLVSQRKGALFEVRDV